MQRQYRNKVEQAVVEITNRCNLRCPHCASASGRARPEEMSLAEIRVVMRDLKELGCRTVTILGGEFLLRPDWLDVAKAVKEEGMSLNLITNGILVTPEIRRLFKSLDPATVGVSIDGATPASYRAIRGVDGFAKCRRLLDELVGDGIQQVNAITTFSSRNLGDFDAFVSEFIGQPFVWQVQLVHKAGERFDDSLLLSRDQYEWFVERVTHCIKTMGDRLKIRTMDDFGYFPFAPELAFLCQIWDGCPAGRRVVGVRANGDVLPCLSLGSGFVEDNVRRRPLVDIWRDPRSFAEFRDKSAERLTGRCAKCIMADRCRAGCSAAAISTTGRLTETRFCIRQVETDKMLDEML